MGCLKAFRTILLVAATAVVASAAPAPVGVQADKAPVTIESLPAIALSHRAKHLMAALDRADAKAVEAAQLEIEAFRRTYSTLDVAPLVEAVALWAREQGMNGKVNLGLEGLQAVERWAPDHPTLLSTRIILMRQQRVQGWFWSFPDLLRLTRLRVLHPAHRWLWMIQHLGMIRLAATLLLWGWALTMGLRYRNAFRHLWEEPLQRKTISPLVAAVIGALILAGPVILGLDPLVAAMVWLFLMAPFLARAEVKVTAFILLLQLVHPALAALEPWAARDPLPSVLTLQLQPQVLPISPAAVRLLPPSDRAFLAGWGQLQNQDWKAATLTFQELVEEHADNLIVIDNQNNGNGAG